MYKKSSDTHDYIKRVGSHSTKASPTGRIDDIPAWAAEPEEYYNTIRDEYRVLVEQLKKTQTQLAEINEKLRHRLPFKEADHLKQHKDRLGDNVRLLESHVANFRPLIRSLGEKSWATVFFYVAKQILKQEDFYLIRDEVRTLLDRAPFEVPKGRGEWSPEKHDNRTRKDNRRESRAKFRKWYGASTTVWSDEDGIRPAHIPAHISPKENEK